MKKILDWIIDDYPPAIRKRVKKPELIKIA